MIGYINALAMYSRRKWYASSKLSAKANRSARPLQHGMCKFCRQLKCLNARFLPTHMTVNVVKAHAEAEALSSAIQTVFGMCLVTAISRQGLLPM